MVRKKLSHSVEAEVMNEQDIVFRLRERARIRRQIPGRKSVQEGAPDRIADLLEEAANEIQSLRDKNQDRNEDVRFEQF